MSDTSIVHVLESHRDSFLTRLPGHIDSDRFFAIAMAVAKSSDLRECTPASVLQAVVGCSQLGLYPDPALGHVYVLPRRIKTETVAQVQVGYRGLIELAGRSRVIADIHAEVVDAADVFRVHKGTDRRIEHEPLVELGDVDSSGLRAAYVTWTDLRSRTTQFHVVGKARVERARKASKSVSSNYSPWASDEAAMWRKTAVIDASKVWPLTTELARAVQWEEQAERHERQTISVADVTEAPQRKRLASLDDEPTDADLQAQVGFNTSDIELEAASNA